jgi:hypothetical protein
LLQLLSFSWDMSISFLVPCRIQLALCSCKVLSAQVTWRSCRLLQTPQNNPWVI